MHSLYEKSEGKPVSYEMYRRMVNELNISFAKLGNEECETCIKHNLHICSPPEEGLTAAEQQSFCGDCLVAETHKIKADKARSLYKNDAESNVDNTKFSVDLQKVVMIPRMPGCKTVAFTRRIIAFNETFAPLGSKKILKNKDIAYAIAWHEGITKRNGEDIASAFIKWLSLYGIREKN